MSRIVETYESPFAGDPILKQAKEREAAFEAMREALRVVRDKYIPLDGDEERDDREAVDAALALADRVSK